MCLGVDCSPAEARFELLRSLVWSLSRTGPVYVARLLSAAIPSWRLLYEREGLDEDTLRTELRDGLSLLLDAGDLVEVAGGRWTAATTRLVRPELDAQYLLIGGAPLSVLPIAPEMVQHHGPHRLLGECEGLTSLLPREDLSAWARIPDGTLNEWAKDLRESLARAPYAPIGHERFEFYLPGGARLHAPQFRRWTEEPGPASATLLARRTRVFGAREYRLVDVAGGRVHGSCGVPAADARRLMYALDSEAENPVQARLSVFESSSIRVVMSSELPRPEKRVLASLGTLDIPVERRWERKWSFRRGGELALSLIRALGVEVVNTSREGRR